MLINIFSRDEIENGEFSPDVMNVWSGKPLEDVVDPDVIKGFGGKFPLNMHYYAAMQGESTRYTDFRKPIKLKSKRPQPKLKPVPHNATVCSEFGVAPANDLMFCGIARGRTDSMEDSANKFMQNCIDAEKGRTIQPGHTGLRDLVLDIDWNRSDYQGWKVIQICASNDSYIKMCNPFRGLNEVIDITEEIDFLSDRGMNLILDAFRESPRCVLFVSLPCTSGCRFNVDINSKRPSSEARIRHNERLFNSLWKRFAELCVKFLNLMFLLFLNGLGTTYFGKYRKSLICSRNLDVL